MKLNIMKWELIMLSNRKSPYVLLTRFSGSVAELASSNCLFSVVKTEKFGL